MTDAQIEIYYNDYGRTSRENKINHLYLDSEGKVTIGVGCLLRNHREAASLKFYHWPDAEHAMKLATSDEIKTEFDKIKGLGKHNRSAQSYRTDTSLFVFDETIEQLFKKRLLDSVKQLKVYFPDFDKFPQPAQDALLDMVFNIGIGNLTHKFISLKDAINRHDWLAAAEASFRYQVGCKTTRNEDTWRNFRKAAVMDPLQPKHAAENDLTGSPNFGCQSRLNEVLARIKAKEAKKTTTSLTHKTHKPFKHHTAAAPGANIKSHKRH